MYTVNFNYHKALNKQHHITPLCRIYYIKSLDSFKIYIWQQKRVKSDCIMRVNMIFKYKLSIGTFTNVFDFAQLFVHV